MVHAGGRIAVLVLFTALFAAAWNSDGRSAVALARTAPITTPRQTARVASAAAELVRIREPAVSPTAGIQLGSGIRLACDETQPAPPFTGTPALLGGTIGIEDAVPVTASKANERL
jgi:hypothetical protein